MFAYWWLVVLIALMAAVAGACLLPRWRQHRRELHLQQARRDFHRRREWLEARFVTLASQSGKPRGLAWTRCDFDDAVTFARDRTSGQLRAFVGVTIGFEAVEGGGMEEVAAVSNLRAATAVFYLQDKRWSTDGRAIFNLNPAQAIQHFQHELEAVRDLGASS